MASAVVATSFHRILPPQRAQACKSSANTWRNNHAHGFLEGSRGSRSLLQLKGAGLAQAPVLANSSS